MIVQTDKGRVEGTTEEGIHVFKGIPYAAPPVGTLRWRPPQDVEAWSDVRKADTFGKACIQPVYEDSLDGSEPVGEQSEDCLYLNVWAPGVDPAAPKPVMVWIHGGAFKVGASHITMFSGLPFAQKGAVVVSFNYRLGNLGFFAHPALEQESPNGPVNFGLQDQIAALEWVKRNIAAFGGDPNNVTIFGQSAGGMSVLALFASPLASGLFHKGISQSPYAIPEFTREKAIELGSKVATGLFKLGPDATPADLRAVPPEVFAVKTMDGPEGQEPVQVPGLAPVPVIDGVVLTKGIRDAFQAGDQKALPLIIGSTSNEASVLAAFGMKPGAVMQKVIESGGEDIEKALNALKQLYDDDPEVKPGDLDNPDRFASLVLRDILFTMQARFISDHHSNKSSSWRYYFSWIPIAFRQNRWGVAHGDEIIFTMGTGDISVGYRGKLTDGDRWMARQVTDYWFSFAATGTPSGEVAWPKNVFAPTYVQLTVDKDHTLKLGETIKDQLNFRRVRLNQFINKYPELEKALSGANQGDAAP
jgi:para-nitrobenzyl esterase